jgi:DNA-binding MarR family transcriptional regulator
MAADELARSPLHLLHRASQCAEQVFAEMVGADVSPRQLAVLTAVAQREGASQTDLVRSTSIDRSTLAEMVRLLTKRGLLERRRTKEDARTYAVRLTDQGRRIVRSVQPLALAVDAHLLAALPRKQRRNFIEALARVVGKWQRP